LLLLQLLSFRAKLCCPTTTVVEFFSCTREKILFPYYHKSRMFLTREIFCSSVTTIAKRLILTRDIFCSSASTIAECFSATTAECFSPDKNSVLVLPQKYSALLIPQ